MLSLSPPFPSSSSVSVRDLGQAIAVLSDRHNSLLCIFSFFFFFFLLEASHTVVLMSLLNVLTIFMVDEFYIYAVVQFYFFCKEV